MSLHIDSRNTLHGWHCSCSPQRLLSLSRRKCDLCGKDLPRQDVQKVYKMVYAEVREDYLAPIGNRWAHFAGKCAEYKKLLSVLLWMWLAFSLAFVLFTMPDVRSNTQTLTTELFAYLRAIITAARSVLSILVEMVTLTFSKVIGLVAEIIETVRNGGW